MAANFIRELCAVTNPYRYLSMLYDLVSPLHQRLHEMYCDPAQMVGTLPIRRLLKVLDEILAYRTVVLRIQG